MTYRHSVSVIASIAALASGILTSQGAVVFNDESTAGNAAAYSGSNSDLINLGTATLASATVAVSFGSPTWQGKGIHDGLDVNLVTANGETALYGISPGFPSVSTFDLDLTTNTLGYDLTSIVSIAGWNHVDVPYPNQQFSVEVSVVGSASYIALFSNHDYSPFSDAGGTGTGSTKVTVTDDGGVLATGVDSIRVTYSDPSIGSRTLIQEFDVLGTATVPEPSTVALLGLCLAGFAFRRRR